MSEALPVARIDDRSGTQEVATSQVVGGDVADDRVVGASDGREAMLLLVGEVLDATAEAVADKVARHETGAATAPS